MTTQTKPPMEFPQVLSQTRRMLAAYVEKPYEDVCHATLSSLGMDSLSGVEFILKLEEHFGIEIPEDTANIKTVEDAARAVEKVLLSKGQVADHPVLPDPASFGERRWIDRDAAYPQIPAEGTGGKLEPPPCDFCSDPATSITYENSQPSPRCDAHPAIYSDDPYHDLLTHHRFWRSYLKRAYSNITEEDSRKHLDHEIAALDRLVEFHRELVGKSEEEQVRELVELLRNAPLANFPTVSEQWAKQVLSRYRLVPRKAI